MGLRPILILQGFNIVRVYMSNSFKSINGKRTFDGFKESTSSSDYIKKKKVRQMFCNANFKTKVVSQGDLQLLRLAKYSKYYCCLDPIDTTNLNINLITRLDLSGVSVIVNNETQQSPTPIEAESLSIAETLAPLIAEQFNLITQGVPSYLQYTIDPNGDLFGNTICGLNNYTRFMTFEDVLTDVLPGYVSCLLPMDDQLSYPQADNLFDINTYSFTENGMNFKSAHLASLLGVTNDHFNWYDPIPYNLRQLGRSFDVSRAVIRVTNIGNKCNNSFFYIQSSLNGVILTSGYIVVDTNNDPGLIVSVYEVADYNNIPPLPSFSE